MYNGISATMCVFKKADPGNVVPLVQYLGKLVLLAGLHLLQKEVILIINFINVIRIITSYALMVVVVVVVITISSVVIAVTTRRSYILGEYDFPTGSLKEFYSDGKAISLCYFSHKVSV